MRTRGASSAQSSVVAAAARWRIVAAGPSRCPTCGAGALGLVPIPGSILAMPLAITGLYALGLWSSSSAATSPANRLQRRSNLPSPSLWTDHSMGSGRHGARVVMGLFGAEHGAVGWAVSSFTNWMRAP